MKLSPAVSHGRIYLPGMGSLPDYFICQLPVFKFVDGTDGPLGCIKYLFPVFPVVHVMGYLFCDTVLIIAFLDTVAPVEHAFSNHQPGGIIIEPYPVGETIDVFSVSFKELVRVPSCLLFL